MQIIFSTRVYVSFNVSILHLILNLNNVKISRLSLAMYTYNFEICETKLVLAFYQTRLEPLNGNYGIGRYAGI